MKVPNKQTQWTLLPAAWLAFSLLLFIALSLIYRGALVLTAVVAMIQACGFMLGLGLGINRRFGPAFPLTRKNFAICFVGYFAYGFTLSLFTIFDHPQDTWHSALLRGAVIGTSGATLMLAIVASFHWHNTKNKDLMERLFEPPTQKN